MEPFAASQVLWGFSWLLLEELNFWWLSGEKISSLIVFSYEVLTVCDSFLKWSLFIVFSQSENQRAGFEPCMVRPSASVVPGRPLRDRSRAPGLALPALLPPALFYLISLIQWQCTYDFGFFFFLFFFFPTSMEYGSSWTRDQNAYWSPDPRCTSDDTGSLTLWATQDELQDDGFRNFHCLKNIWKPSLWGTGVILHTKKKLLLLKNSFRLFTSPRREIRDFFPLSQSQVLPWLECLEFFFFLTKEVSAL